MGGRDGLRDPNYGLGSWPRAVPRAAVLAQPQATEQELMGYRIRRPCKLSSKLHVADDPKFRS
jgi:hypothetical protein